MAQFTHSDGHPEPAGAIVQCLQRVRDNYAQDPGVTEAQRVSLELLIATYLPDPAGKNLAVTPGKATGEGAILKDLRAQLAAGAGIVDLAQLIRLAELDQKLSNGMCETIDITDLTVEDYLAKFVP